MSLALKPGGSSLYLEGKGDPAGNTPNRVSKFFSTYEVFAVGLRVDITRPTAMSAIPNQVR